MSAEPNLLDEQYMQRALELAARGERTTSPNPRVGCVVVNGDEIVGEGWHRYAGEPHAERIALKQAGEKARGASVYVNLEPCCHQGRTPPCSDALIDAGVARLFAAIQDPNPLVAGGGFQVLEDAGIEVSFGIESERASWLNRGFISRMRRQRPWMMLKVASSLDGRTAAFDGESQWLTGSDARNEVHQLRAKHAAMLTGIGTALADDSRMTARLDDQQRQPHRVLLDTELRLDSAARIIGTDGQCVIFTASDDQDKARMLTDKGAQIVDVEREQGGGLDLSAVMQELNEWQFNEVMVEAGPLLCGALLAAGLIDEMNVYYAPTVLGDAAKSMFTFDSALAFTDRIAYDVRAVQKLATDIRVQLVRPHSLEEIQACLPE